MDLLLILAVLLVGGAVLVYGVEKLLTRSQPQRHTLAELEYFDVVPDHEGSFVGPVVGTTEWGGLFVESGPMSVIIVLLPVVDRASRRRIPDARASAIEINALIAVPHPAGGHLWRDEVAERFGIDEHDIFTSAEDFSGTIDAGALTVQPHRSGVRISWNDGNEAMIVGVELELADMTGDAALIRIAGSLAETQDLSADGVDQLLTRLRRVDLLGNVPPANPEVALFNAAIDELETRVTVDHPADYDQGVDFGLQWLFRELSDGRWVALEDGLELVATSCYQDLVLELILSDRIDDAVRVADFGREHIDPALFAHHRGILSTMRDRLEEARDWFATAVDEDEDYRDAEVCLAAIDGSGRARELLADYESDAAMQRVEPFAAPEHLDPKRVATRLSGLSEYAALRANIFIAEGSFEDAEGLLRRALDLDPGNALTLARLGETLFAAGRVEDAMEVFDSADVPSAARARLERARGRCLEDLRRWKDAADAYERAVDVAPQWDAARLDAIAVYSRLANRSRGEAHIDYLAEHSTLDESEIGDLRAQLD
jgi:tetratricopeptide (TPR) repeat protein